MDIPEDLFPEAPDDWPGHPAPEPGPEPAGPEPAGPEPVGPEPAGPDDHTAPPAAVAAATLGGAAGIRGIRARLRRRRTAPAPVPIAGPDTEGPVLDAVAADRAALVACCVDLDDLLTGAAHRERLRRGLRAAGVEVLHPAGERFDPQRHCAVGTEPAPDPDRDRTIARVERVGFTDRGTEVRPPEVIVYRA